MEFILSTQINEYGSYLYSRRYFPLDEIEKDNYLALREQQKEASTQFVEERQAQLVSGARGVSFISSDSPK